MSPPLEFWLYWFSLEFWLHLFYLSDKHLQVLCLLTHPCVWQKHFASSSPYLQSSSQGANLPNTMWLCFTLLSRKLQVPWDCLGTCQLNCCTCTTGFHTRPCPMGFTFTGYLYILNSKMGKKFPAHCHLSLPSLLSRPHSSLTGDFSSPSSSQTCIEVTASLFSS